MAKIFICGMPGSGKTTLGKAISNHLSYPFFDLDELIEEKEKRDVKDIFEKDGEEYFRKVEEEALWKFAQWGKSKKQYVCALGGGTPCFYDNLRLIKSSGLLVFLNPKLSVISDRMLSEVETTKRPLIAHLKSNQIAGDLQEKYEKRIGYYKQAHIKTKGDESVAAVSYKILNYWNLILKGQPES